MYTIILSTVLMLAPIAHAGGSARCTTREDPELQRWVTECTDGSRAITKWDAPFNRYRTDITTPPQNGGARTKRVTFQLASSRRL